MFDSVTRDLLRAAPNLPDLPSEMLADQLTAAYAEIAAARVTIAGVPEDLEQHLLPVAQQMARIADLLEAQVILGINADRMKPAAFAAASARQVLFQIARLIGTRRESWVDAQSISPEIAAGILFMIAGRSADAFEMARFISAPDSLPGSNRAAIIAVKHFLQGQLRLIFRLGKRERYAPREFAPLPELASDLLYQKIVLGLSELAHDLLGHTEGVGLERALQAFAQVRQLAVDDERTLDLADAELRFESRSMFPGPHQLAGLLGRAAPTFSDAAIVKIGAPSGAGNDIWSDWVKSEAKHWPYLWENHRRAVETGYLNAGTSAVMSSPTGSGKSTLALLKMVATLSTAKSVVYLAPTHALVNQIERDLSGRLPSSTTATSLEESLDDEIGQRLPDVAVMTPERCFALLTYAPELFENVGLLVFDECHLLGGGIDEESDVPDRRSIDAMLCLLSFVTAAPEADILLMSAMISNGTDICDWVATATNRDCRAFEDEWKPTRQLKGAVVYDRNELAEVQRALAADWAARESKPKQPPVAVSALSKAKPFAVFSLSENWNPLARDKYALRQLSNAPLQLGVGARRWGWTITSNRNEVAGALAGQFQGGGLKAIVFCESIVATGSVAKRLNEVADPEPLVLEKSEANWLKTAIEEVGAIEGVYAPGSGPAAVHHGELLPEERSLVESVFRRRRSGVNVLAATSTLAQGLNLPCEMVILAGTDRADDLEDGPKRQDLEPHEILNALGRAGRAGFAATGLAMVVPANPIECNPPTSRVAADPLLALTFSGQDQCVPLVDPVTLLFDRIASEGPTTDEATYLLRKLTLSLGAAADGVESFDQLARRTFGYFQKVRADAAAAEDWLQKRRASLQGLIDAAQEEPIVDWQASLAAKTGASPAFVARLVAAYQEAPHTSLSAREWMHWLLGQLSPDEWEFDLFLRPSTLERVFGRAFRQCGTPQERRDLARQGVLQVLDQWLAGSTLLQLEEVISAFARAHEGQVKQPTTSDSKAKRGRRFALRLAPDLGYLCGLIAHISRKLRADAATPPLIALETLPQQIRKGMETPQHLYLLRAEKFSRVGTYARYAELAPYLPPNPPTDWEGVRNQVQIADITHMFANGDV